MTKYLILIGIILLWLPLIVKAEPFSFNPDYLISDYELTNWQAMSREEIIEFLKKENGALANYFSKDLDNQLKHAGEIIYNASQRHQINPQVLITLVQKEQNLVTQQMVKPSQFDWAAGFACYDYRRPVSRFSGFATQVDRAAWRLRYFLEYPWEFRFRPNQVYKINGHLVRPQNLATAALYNYTPYLRGSKLFWKIWQKWFAKKGLLPNGVLVRVKNDKGVWLIQDGKRRPFYSKAVFLASYSFDKVIEISQKDLEQYERGEPMTFPNYSLLKASTGEIYLLVDGLKRKIASLEVFRKIGFNPEEVNLAENSDLDQYPEGRPITTPYPNGALLQDKLSGAVYYVKDEIKYPIIDKIILKNNFPYNQIIKVKTEELNKFINGEPIKLTDSTLVKSSNQSTVYVISRGKRRPIINPETFEALGYLWENILTVPDNVLNIHPIGEILDINNL
ncbi:MAG: hypothetical protein ACP5IX_01205 [Patescibacteria group bacterium]